MELHSDTFNPEDFPWQGLTLTPAAAARWKAARTPRADANASGGSAHT